MTLPPRVLEWLAAHVEQDRHAAALLVDDAGNLADWSGPVERYGLRDLVRGRPAAHCCDWLAGLLPRPEPLHLPRLVTDGVLHFDVHLLPEDGRTWVVLLDASEEARHQYAAQRVTHELALLRRREGATHGAPDLLTEVMRALDMALIAREAGGAYRVREPVPPWFAAQFPEYLAGGEPDPTHFLGNFIAEAEEFWAGRDPGPLRSGEWSEARGEGLERRFEAVALRLADGGEVILVQIVHEHDERRQILQAARENGLQLRRLAKEIERKEVLLHCIVHDLAGPLTSIEGALEMLGRDDLPAATVRRMVDIGRRQARALEGRIRQILGVFRAELEALEAFTVDPELAPDLLASLRELEAALTAAFAARRVRLAVHTPADVSGSWRVVGQAGRLERVLSNLLENALRHAAVGTTVDVSLARTDAEVELRIADRGPGVPPELQGRLFEKLAQGSMSGKVGLGLYFCRMSVARWGGKIAYEAREGGGACFVVTLCRALTPPAAAPDAGADSPRPDG